MKCGNNLALYLLSAKQFKLKSSNVRTRSGCFNDPTQVWFSNEICWSDGKKYFEQNISSTLVFPQKSLAEFSDIIRMPFILQLEDPPPSPPSLVKNKLSPIFLSFWKALLNYFYWFLTFSKLCLYVYDLYQLYNNYLFYKLLPFKHPLIIVIHKRINRLQIFF